MGPCNMRSFVSGFFHWASRFRGCCMYQCFLLFLFPNSTPSYGYTTSFLSCQLKMYGAELINVFIYGSWVSCHNYCAYIVSIVSLSIFMVSFLMFKSLIHWEVFSGVRWEIWMKIMCSFPDGYPAITTILKNDSPFPHWFELWPTF